MEEAKEMKCFKRLMIKQFVQVSGLCGPKFYKSCVNWLILQVKIEKDSYFCDFCKILFQLNCFFLPK